MLCEEFDSPIKTGLCRKKSNFQDILYIFVLTLIAAALEREMLPQEKFMLGKEGKR